MKLLKLQSSSQDTAFSKILPTNTNNSILSTQLWLIMAKTGRAGRHGTGWESLDRKEERKKEKKEKKFSILFPRMENIDCIVEE
jgi:hypothetical protein